MSRVIEKNIKEAVNKSRNIFDLYLLLYVFLKGREASVLSNYRGNEKLKVSKCQFQAKKILINDQFKIILTTESKEVLMDFIERYRFDEMALFALFMEIDLVFGEMNYEHSKANQESFGEKLEESKPLNTSVTRSLGLVYRVRKSFVPRFLGESQYPRPRLHKYKGTCLEGVQTNFLVYKLDSWSDYQIDLYSLRCEYVAERLKYQKEIRIGLVPFTGVHVEKFLRIRDIGSDFIIEGIRDEDTSIGKVLYTMERLKEEGVDIVVFPEMTFTPKLLGEVKNYLRSNLGSFLLIVCGSIWEYGRNYSILLNGNGHQLLKQYKNNIYHKTEEFSSKGNNEGLILDSSKRKIKVLDIENLGRLVIPICADFIVPSSFQQIAKIGVNLCLIPAYSSSISDFQRNAEELGSHNHGAVFLANCCSFVKPNKKILFHYLPIKLPYEIERDGERISLDQPEKACIVACADKSHCFELPQCYYVISVGKNVFKTRRVCYNKSESKLCINGL